MLDLRFVGRGRHQNGPAQLAVDLQHQLDLVALKIRDLATEHRVPVLEAPPLARALYANTELEQEVPVALYTAVAQVMAYVFQLRQALSGQAPMPGNLPDLDVPRELDPQQSDQAKARAAAMQAEVEA